MFLSKALYPLLIIGSPRGTRPDMTENIIDWDVKNQNKKGSQPFTYKLMCFMSVRWQMISGGK